MHICISLFAVQCEDEVHPNARISWMPRREVSQGGGVLTIFGSNFAADNFNQFEPDLGNRVSEKSYPRVLQVFNLSNKTLVNLFLITNEENALNNISIVNWRFVKYSCSSHSHN